MADEDAPQDPHSLDPGQERRVDQEHDCCAVLRAEVTLLPASVQEVRSVCILEYRLLVSRLGTAEFFEGFRKESARLE